MTRVTLGEYWGPWSCNWHLACRIADMDFECEPQIAWVWTVTDAEIRVAKRDWLRARDDGAAAEDVEMAFEYYRMLMSAQAQQIADEFRAQHSA